MWLGAGNRVKVQRVVFVAGANPSFAESLLLRYFPLEREEEDREDEVREEEREEAKKVPTDPDSILEEMVSSPDQVTSRPD